MNIKEAICSENIEAVKDILEREPMKIDEADENGIIMPFLAAKTGNLKLVRYIVEYSRANMNIYDSGHRNMLHYAAISGNVELCRYLVERVGISVLEGDYDLITPIDIAKKQNNQKLLEYFEQEIGVTYDRLYRNPIRTGMYPDPSIVRVDDTYYMVNSSFIYFPCIPVSESKDLIHWKIIGYAITDPEWAALDELEGGRGYWAPDISYYDGRFYITATYRLNDTGTVYRKQIVVSSDRPEGPYSEPAIIDEDGIDPSIFNDDDNRRYMLLNRGARILELDSTATKQISPARLLYYGDNKRAPEGPHLLKYNGYYYLFEAEGGTGPGHRITVSRSRELMGRYEPCPYNPIMRQNDEGAGIQRCGHGKPVCTQYGEWYMVYLCGRTIMNEKNGQQYSILGRETALDPIQWTKDDWPVVNNLNGPGVLQIKPELEECIYKQDNFDDFDGKELSLNWVTPRPPETDGIAVKDSCVIIKGSEEDLNSMYSRNILLRRQQHFKFSAECKMIIPELKSGQDAGMTCYYDENTFLKFGIFCDADGMKKCRVMEYIDGYRQGAEAVVPLSTREIYFKMSADYFKRSFSYSYNGCDYYELTELDNVYYLSDEGIKKGKRFTGAMVGMYAHAGKAELRVEFDYFNYIQEEK